MNSNRILVADDDSVSRRLLDAMLTDWGYDVVPVSSGVEAMEEIVKPDTPAVLLLDWIMPGMDGLEVCRRVRELDIDKRIPYIIMLSVKEGPSNVVEGLNTGADDYVAKPFDPDELRARIRVGVRMVELQNALSERVEELEDAMSKVKSLEGMLPICSLCKKVRDDQGYWNQIEMYISAHSDATFTHGMCPPCIQSYYPEFNDSRTASS